MKISEIGPKFKAINDVIAFKWIKPKNRSRQIIIPDIVADRPYKYDNQRLGNKYVCQAISCGSDCHEIKPGNFFLLHEFNCINKTKGWLEDEVMFCYENNVLAIITGDEDYTTFAGPITETMEKEFCKDDNDVKVSYKQ